MTHIVQDENMVDAIDNLNIEIGADTTTDDTESDPTNHLGSAQRQLKAIAIVKHILKAMNSD